MEKYAFGVDIGGTNIKMGLFSVDGQLVEKWEIPTHIEQNGTYILPEIAQVLQKKMIERTIEPRQVEGIGIGVPGPVDADGIVYKCNNLGWGIFNLKERMRQLLPEIPKVMVGNDANTAALGELWQGGAAGYESTVLLTLGTGIGGGVVLNGRIITGKNGGAGEVGHITVEPEETVPCTCGKRGCLEQYASASGVVFLAKRMLRESNKLSELRNMDTFTAKEICDLAKAGEEMAGDIMDAFGEYLGRALSFISCTIDPDVYMIGGGMNRAGTIVTDAIMKYYKKYAFHVSSGTQVVLAKLGNDAGIYGCAQMIFSSDDM